MRFSEAIMDDKLASSDSNYLHAYGIYLANGGTPEGFLEMTNEDINIMYASYMAIQKRNTKDILEGIISILNKAFGGE